MLQKQEFNNRHTDNPDAKHPCSDSQELTEHFNKSLVHNNPIDKHDKDIQ
jgi:hypothetical protein